MTDPNIDRLREFIGAWHRDTVDVMEAEAALDALAADIDAAKQERDELAVSIGFWEARLAELDRELSWEREVVVVDLRERVAELETALREIAEGKVKPAKAGRGEWARTSLVLGMQLRARAALAADAADTEEPDTPPRTIEQMAESLDKWTEPADTDVVSMTQVLVAAWDEMHREARVREARVAELETALRELLDAGKAEVSGGWWVPYDRVSVVDRARAARSLVRRAESARAIPSIRCPSLLSRMLRHDRP